MVRVRGGAGRAGVVMRRLAILAVVLAPAAALAGGVQPEAQRTASWYAAHPAIMLRVARACQNDPGHGWNNPDCLNAQQGQVLQAEADARRHSVDLTPPTSPRYWKLHPGELPQELAYCARMTNPVDRANFFCPSALEAAR